MKDDLGVDLANCWGGLGGLCNALISLVLSLGEVEARGLLLGGGAQMCPFLQQSSDVQPAVQNWTSLFYGNAWDLAHLTSVLAFRTGRSRGI